MKKEQTRENEHHLSNWIPFPRKIASDYKNGIITRAEYHVYCHIRLQCNPYGIATIHLDALKDDVFGSESSEKSVTKNYVNKILLSLKSKRMLFYENRTGRVGSFEVRFPNFITPGKHLTAINNLFETEISKKDTHPSNAEQSEAITEVGGINQKIKLPENIINKANSDVNKFEEIRGSNNDTNIENYIENTDLSATYKKGNETGGDITTKYSCKNPTDSFSPKSYEEFTAKEIAEKVGERCIDRYLSLIRMGNFGLLEKAYGEYKEDVEKEKKIESPPAYLNSIIQRLVISKTRREVGKT